MKIEICEKNFKFRYENLNKNMLFKPIFYPMFQELCYFIQIWKKTPFLFNIFSVSGGVLALDNAIEISSCKYVAHQTVAWKPQSLMHSSIRVLHF